MFYVKDPVQTIFMLLPGISLLLEFGLSVSIVMMIAIIRLR